MVNNFVIDHVLRGIMTKKNGEYMWSINQITNPSLNVSLSDTAQAVDALGTPIQEIDRGRSAEFGAENSIFDLSMYAAQMGKEVDVASSTSTINVPAFETIDVAGVEGESYVTKKSPIEKITKIYGMNPDGTLGKAYTLSTTTVSKDEFAFDEATHTISLPIGLEKGSSLFVMYEYASEKATAVTADAINFPKNGKFIMEVLGTSVCDPDTLVHAYVVFPNAKLDGNVDYSFTTDGTHPFTIRAMQDYCDKEKKLFSIIIPEEE
jgi:hypothetical protein